MASKVVGLVGTPGHVGAATVKALAAKYPALKVLAGVRNTASEKSKALQAGANITLVEADMANPATIAANLKGVDSAFVIAPGVENRGPLSIAAIDALKAAGAKSLVVLSVATADEPEIFGRQFKPVEERAKASGVPFVILRLPLFIDNNWANVESIKGAGQIYGAAKPASRYGAIAVQDVGTAAALILSNPAPHLGKTYTLTGPASSPEGDCVAFSKALGKPVTYVHVPFEAAKAAMMGKGFPEWQVDGIIELLKGMDAGSSSGVVTDEFKKLTGADPIGPEQWMAAVKGAFL